MIIRRKRAKIGRKAVIGLSEEVMIIGPLKSRKLMARIDTGATKGSIDIKLAKEIGIKKTKRKILVKSASGIKFRPLIKVEVKLGGKKIKELFNLADRSHMRYKVLIGQNILKKGFLIDPNK